MFADVAAVSLGTLVVTNPVSHVRPSSQQSRTAGGSDQELLINMHESVAFFLSASPLGGRPVKYLHTT